MGKKFLYRTAASFVRVRAGISKKKLLVPADKADNALIIAGSYIQKTTKQIEELCKNISVRYLEISITRILNDRERYMKELINLTDDSLASGKNVLLVTERKYSDFGSEDENQLRAQEISIFLSGIVAGLNVYPGVIISKGGITSHDIAKHGLGIEQAEVLGQIEPGVPILRLSSESKAAGSYFVIFPGNVGEPDTLHIIAQKLLTGNEIID